MKYVKYVQTFLSKKSFILCQKNFEVFKVASGKKRQKC